MKIAIYVPDDLLDAVDREARRTGRSRGRLVAEALAEHLAGHAPDDATEAMDRVIERLGNWAPDPEVHAERSARPEPSCPFEIGPHRPLLGRPSIPAHGAPTGREHEPLT